MQSTNCVNQKRKKVQDKRIDEAYEIMKRTVTKKAKEIKNVYLNSWHQYWTIIQIVVETLYNI